MNEHLTHLPDSWSPLRRHTSARIALGRAGASLPTKAILDFAAAHAAARDAVHAALDVGAMESELAELGLPILCLNTLAGGRATYLHRPDLGRRLDEPSVAALRVNAGREVDIAIQIGDGLSAVAAYQQALPLLRQLLPMFHAACLQVGPLCIVRQARVAVQDQIGSLLNARLSIILIGERPGLGTEDSLGAYLVFDPRPGRTDAQRNCVSNIRAGGLAHAAAAATLHFLVIESLRREISGVALKDQRRLPSEKSISEATVVKQISSPA